MYMAELAPPSIRGGLVNFYQSWMMVGAILACSVVYGAFYNAAGKWIYLTPIVVQIIPPVLLLMAVWFIPESPRWLLSKNKKEQALKALLYMRKGASSEEETAQELDLVAAATEQEIELHRASSYLDCFRGSNFYRTLVAVGVQCLQQAQGNSFTQAYLVIFLQQLGVNDPLLIKIAHACCSFGGTVLAFYLTDELGRRKMLIGGAFLMGATLWVTSGLAAWTPGGVHGAKAQTAIAMILLNAAISTGAWGSCMWTVTVEVSTQQLRERTIALATIFGFITSLLITYINPYVQNEPGNLGAKVGLIYGSMSVIAIAFVYFIVPEMKGRSLEELDEMFHSRVPAWRSKAFVSDGLGAQITRVQNADASVMDTKSSDHESIQETPHSKGL
ncbi:uncharacterized protein LTR77_010248 [Saxophila tyrrhenica]|uniref:Major facilitator superfamily (MFS) profile domain-containing protein n=1 Tax=Saxophila tyrrhenica TaxID=1690608 RepID=A0AAV9NZ44_9PEZI|nr:hypothetical protein LTR77_010248 [Saxophila tyrrhenica]